MLRNADLSMLHTSKPPNMIKKMYLAFLSDPLQWLGCIFSMVGAQLLSEASSIAPWGWIFFLMGNVAFIAWGYTRKMMPILVMQLYFLTTSVKGIVNHLF